METAVCSTVLFLKIKLHIKIVPLYIASFVGIKVSFVFLRIKVFGPRIMFYISSK